MGRAPDEAVHECAEAALSNSVWVRLAMRRQNSCRMKKLIRKAVAPTRLDTNSIKKALPKAEGFATTIATSKSDHYLRGGARRPEHLANLRLPVNRNSPD